MKLKLSTLVSLAVMALASVACSKDDRNAPRTDAFELHALADCSDEPLNEFCVNVLEGTSELYIKTDVADFEVFWQDAAPSPWLEVVSCEKTSDPSVWKMTLSYAQRSSGVLYTRRTGTLSVTKKQINLGTFLPVHQGAIERIGEDFSDFKYGSWLPTDFSGEKLCSEWTDALRKKGFSSEPVAESYSCYGRYGHLRLGDAAGSKGNLLTPTSSLHRYDSLLMVTFKAASYPGDDKSFKVDVVGGGVIRDFVQEGKTSMTFQTEDIITNAVTQEGLWKPESNFIVFIASTETNPVGVNTCLKITSGASSSSAGSRLFIDDYYVTKLVDGKDVDYYQLNQGSGKDRILASNNE
jgi:hypothetical protein